MEIAHSYQIQFQEGKRFNNSLARCVAAGYKERKLQCEQNSWCMSIEL